MQIVNNQNWFNTETKTIQQTAKVSPEEAKAILKQRILDYAKRHNISQEEAAKHYSNISKNTKTKKL